MNDNVCEICGMPEQYKSNGHKIKNLAIDHDHESGIQRGRLCHRCNTGLGMFRDDPDILQKAIDYLRLDWNTITEDRKKTAAKLLKFPYKSRVRDE